MASATRPNSRRRRRWIPLGGALGLERDGGEGLPDLVVELPRDPQTLRLLGGQRSSGRLVARPLQAVEHRIESRGERLTLGAAGVHPRKSPAGPVRIDRRHHLCEVDEG